MLANTQILRLRKAFANGFSANIDLSKTQLHKIGKLGGFFSRPVEPLLKTALPLIGNVLVLLSKSVFIHLWLTAPAAASTDAAICKKMFGSASPNTGCLSRRWPLLGTRKLSPKKLKLLIFIN